MPSSDFDTPAKRFRLKPRKNPYWFGVSGGRGGLSLGFRRTVKGEGVWVAKIVLDGQRIEERVGTPDGDRALPGSLSFARATEAAGKTAGCLCQDHNRSCGRPEDPDCPARSGNLCRHAEGARRSKRLGRFAQTARHERPGVCRSQAWQA
jgi:hypothetical protein